MYYRRKYSARIYLLLLIPILAAGIYWVIFSYVRPVFLEYAKNYVQHEASFALYTVLTDEVYQNRETYQGLVQLERDANEAVTALKTDGITANYLKTQITRAIYEQLDTLEKSKVKVPLGTILEPEIFGGMGPELEIGVAGLGYAHADFISVFSEAGINQTRHQILLEVTAQIHIMTSMGGADTEVSNQLVVSDTVIVGNVPEQYTYIDDTEQSLLGKINDYAG